MSLIKKRLLLSLLITQSFLVLQPSNVLADQNQPRHVPNGFYANIGVGENEFSASQMTGFSIASDKKIERDLNKTNVSGLKPFYLLSFGYADDDLPIRGEFQYLKTSDLEYRASTLFNDSATPQISNLNAKISSQALLLNGYVDQMGKYSNFMPYVMLGIGYASNSAKWTSGYAPNQLTGSDKTNSFAWQLGLGSRIRITDNFFADIGLRYLTLGKLNCDMVNVGISSKELQSIQASLSLTLFLGDQSKPAPSLINDDTE